MDPIDQNNAIPWVLGQEGSQRMEVRSAIGNENIAGQPWQAERLPILFTDTGKNRHGLRRGGREVRQDERLNCSEVATDRLALRMGASLFIQLLLSRLQ